MNKPKFSIIIPTFNRSYVLWKAILSIKNQTFTDWELIVVDDGSTDSTKKLMAEFQDDHRIKYIYQHNQKTAAARNRGLAVSQGEIIVYLDSDDELYPNALSAIQRLLESNKEKTWGVYNHNRSIEFLNADSITTHFKIDQGTQKDVITLQDFYDWSVKSYTGIFHKREPFIDKAKWTTGIAIEDLEYIMQLAVLDEHGFIHLPQTLLNYRQKYGSDGLCSQATYGTWAHAFKTIYELHKNDPLMKKPEVYLGRVKKYSELYELEKKGKTTPQVFKYFPELSDAK